MGYKLGSWIYKNQVREYFKYWYKITHSYNIAEALDSISFINKNLIENKEDCKIVFKDFNATSSSFSWERPYAYGKHLVSLWLCLEKLNLGEVIEYTNTYKSGRKELLIYFKFNKEEINTFLINYKSLPNKLIII